MSVPQIGDLQIDQDLDFQRKAWTVQRIGWFAMLAIGVLAALGLFGPGLLSDRDASAEDDSLTVHYRRFVRADARTALAMNVSTAQATNGQVRVWLDADYTDAMQIERVTPEPVEVQSDGNRLIYTFAVAGDAPSIDVTFEMRPDDAGSHDGEAGLEGGSSATFSQFVLP